ncbi:hypothetical protein EDC55_12912 [Allofrancisella inopinata]|uniref:Putative adhesin Stv domain-containing protein n=1 Tax=Allofrancisella inopinata TaxID=1085647 RepID=A0AAE7CQK8_9GAMM|nr:hypothetical protein [Allofrancisella inopinata]QIV95459.1 hypothetical protein E4K63_00840 [Allofrancisella inopinata]TDT66967.1 hypothetical protein EDC55_12912 [Allofrancisella inopinata]
MSVEVEAKLNKRGSIKLPGGSTKDVFSCGLHNKVVAIQFDYYYLFVNTDWLTSFKKNPNHSLTVFLSAHGGPNGKTINIANKTIFIYSPHGAPLLSPPIGEYLARRCEPFAKISNGKLHPHRVNDLRDLLENKQGIKHYTGTTDLITFSDYTLQKFENTNQRLQEFILELGGHSSNNGVMIVRNRGGGLFDGSLSGAMTVLSNEHKLNINTWHLSFCRGNTLNDYDIKENKQNRISKVPDLRNYKSIEDRDIFSASLITHIQNNIKNLENKSQRANMEEDLKDAIIEILDSRIQEYGELDDNHRNGFLFIRSGYTKGQKREAISKLKKFLEKDLNSRTFFIFNDNILKILNNGKTGKMLLKVCKRHNQASLTEAIQTLRSNDI